MKELKVGDKVRVRRDLEQNEYGGCYFTGEMDKYKGKQATIIEGFKIFSGQTCYKIDIDSPRKWSWTNEMLEDVEFSMSDIKDSMVILTRDEGYYVCLNGYFMDKSGYGYLNPEGFTEDLMSDDELREFDIMAVYKSKGNCFSNLFNEGNLQLIWERPEEVKEMSIEEIKKALNITCEFKIKE